MTTGFKSLIVLMGLPSSGKSTIANLLAKKITEKYHILCTVVGTDDIRKMIPSQSEQFNPDFEPFIKSWTLNNIRFCLKNERIVINDDMNYYKSMRHDLKQVAEKNQANFVLIHIKIPLETALKWNIKRGSPIPQDVIKRVADRLDLPGDYKWDTPLATIQTDKIGAESAAQKILSEIASVITTPFEPELPPPHSKPSIHEKVDKLTRDVVADFAQLEKDSNLLKQISSFRKDYLKLIMVQDITIESIKKDFTKKLKEYISQLKQAI